MEIAVFRKLPMMAHTTLSKGEGAKEADGLIRLTLQIQHYHLILTIKT